MGGRGASSGVSASGKPYGSECKTLLSSGNIKFVKSNFSTAATAPMETMTKGRVYATIVNKDRVKYITYFDKNNKRYKQIDVAGQKHMIEGEELIPHTHKGYFHDEKGTHRLSDKEKKMLERVLRTWDNNRK